MGRLRANPLTQIDKLVFSSNQLIEEVPPTKAKRRPLYFGLAILGVAVATAATLALWRAAFRTPSPPKVLRFTRLTNDGQGKFGPMVTDGSRIYFNELLPGPRNLVVQVSVKGGEATSLSVPLALPVVLDLSRDGTELLVADSVLANEVGIQFQVANGMFAIVRLRAPGALGAAGRGWIAAPDRDDPRCRCPVWSVYNQHHLWNWTRHKLGKRGWILFSKNSLDRRQ